MPFLATAGSGAAQGLGQNLKLPTVFSGVPVENFFQTGTVMTGLGAAWSITCLGMPGKTTSATGWGLMLMKIGTVVSGTRSYESGVFLVFDSGVGTGKYNLNNSGEATDATSLTSVTGASSDLTFTFGTSSVTSGTATTKIIWKYYAFFQGDTGFGFTRTLYTGNNTTNRVINGDSPAVTWQPDMVMVMNRNNGSMWWYCQGQTRSNLLFLNGDAAPALGLDRRD